MKRTTKLLILTSVLLVGVMVSAKSTGLRESATDTLSNNAGINLRAVKVGNSDKVSYSRTFVQTGKNLETGNEVLRYATAVTGDVKSMTYTRTIEGLQDFSKKVTSVYKGIEAGDKVYYYDGVDLTTEQSEATDKYYWACYTIEFATSTYKAADIKVSLSIEDESGETYLPESKVGNLDKLTSKVVEFNFDSEVENGVDLSTAGTVADGRISLNGSCKGLTLPEPITISNKESFTIEATVRTGAGGVLLSTGDSTGGFLNIPSNKDDAPTNGFTLRDPSGTNSMFFTKDTSKLGDKKHLAMVYDKNAGTLKAYEDGVEMPFKNQKGSWAAFSETEFVKLFGGFATAYQFAGEVYHFRYINKALDKSEFKVETDKVLEFNFDSYQENGYDFTKNGTIENGMLKVTTRSAHTLKEPITITNRNSFSIEMTVNTYAAGKGGTGDIILQTAKGNTSAGFLNVPSGNNDAPGNGFTLRDPDRSFNRLFMKDTNKLGQKTHLVMVYNANTRTLKAYQDGVEMKIQTGQNTGDIDTMKDMTFITFLSGFSGDIYHFRYIDRDLAVSEFKTNE